MKRKCVLLFCVLLLGLSIMTLSGFNSGKSSAATGPANFPRSLVSITFDDNYASQFQNAVPFLNSEAINMKATFYTVTFDIDNEPDYINLEDLQAMKASGHEIGSHSVNHPDLTTLDDVQLNAELANSKQTLEAEGVDLGPISDFACPNGAFDERTTAAVKSYYASQREGWGNGINNPGNFDPYHIKAKLIEPTTTAAEIAGLLSDAAANNWWIVLIYHEVTDTPLDPTYATGVQAFQEQIQAIKNSGVTAVTMRQALDEIMPLFSYSINASAPGGHGTVTPESQAVTCEQNATINLNPETGYHVESITDNDNPVPAPYGTTYTINKVTEDHDVVVTFAVDSFTVTASVAGEHGSLSPDSQPVAFGGTATINITPDDGYQIASITDNGVSAAISNPFTISNVVENHNVVVTFSAIPASFTVTSISPNSVSQNAFFVWVDIAGSGFEPGSTVRFEKGTTIMQPSGTGIESDIKITCSMWLFGNEAGAYDVVVTRPDGQEARLAGGLMVESQCGQGSGAGILMLGMALGLLSLAGSSRLRRNRKVR